MAFVFYDTETTGTETAFDQILQFAAIKTDDDFGELARFEIRCRLRPDVVPAPDALLTNRVSVALLTQPSLPTHYEAIVEIRKRLRSWSPAKFVGYNSIKFDEELLRQAFFQTLHPAYLTNTNGNCRVDIMRVAHAASVYAPNNIAVPLNEQGQETFRLEHIAPLNGYQGHQAHDAVGDVLATIFMARLIKQRCPVVWDAMMLTANKTDAIDLVIDKPVVAFTERYFSSAHSWLVTYCGRNPDYDAQVGVFDLAHDPDNYVDLSVEDLIAVLNKSPKVIRALPTNRQPILMDADQAPTSAKATQISQEELLRRVSAIRNNGDFQERVGRALAGRFADKPPSPHVEERIYDSFPSNEDQAVAAKFHLVEWGQRHELLDQLADDRLRQFGLRLIYLDRPDVLVDETHREITAGIRERMFSTDESVPWMTVPKALSRIEQLLINAATDIKSLLGEVRAYLLNLSAQHGS